CHEHIISCVEKRLSLPEFYTADEVFTTGTMGELTRVRQIDGRDIISKTDESVLERLKAHFQAMVGIMTS
ncbi:MAG: aminotransferase IV, partial [Bacteroidota bacterium]